MKGQMEFPVLTFIVVVVILLFLAPVILKIVNAILNPISAQLGNQTAVAGRNVLFIQTSFTNFWDWIILIAFLIQVILLLVSAYFIDTHPIFLVLYVILAFVTILFVPTYQEILNAVWNNPQFATEVTDLPFMEFIKNYFELIVMGIIFISGIVIYGKLRYSKETTGGKY